MRAAILAILALGALVPGLAHAQVTDELAGPAGSPDVIPTSNEVGPVGIVDELMLAHSDLTDIMLRQSLGDFDTPDLPFIVTYVDEENGELVVVMDAIAALVGITYEEAEVQVAIGRDVPVEIQYGTVFLDAAPSRAQQWIDYYKERCVPIRPGFQSACATYERILRGYGVDPATLGSSITGPTRTLSTANPCDSDPSSLTCYYYNQYLTRCLPTRADSRCSTYATQIETAGYAVPTRQPATDTTPPVISVPNTITRTTSDPSGLRVWYTVTATDDRDGRVSVSCSPSSGSQFPPGYTRVSCTARDSSGNTASRSFHVNVRHEPLDTTAPVITVPDDITASTADAAGTTVTYSVSARDDVDGAITPTCSPASGTTFAVGTTTVSCTARDSTGNTGRAEFTVTVMHAPIVINEFYGGDRHIVRFHDSRGHEGLQRGTITLGAINSNNVMGMVVSGHTAELVNRVFISHDAQHGDQQEIISREMVPFHVSGTADAAFVPSLEPDVLIHDKIRAHNGTIIDVTQGRLADVDLDQTLYMYGGITNSHGRLLFKNVTVNDLGEAFITEVGIATYDSRSGDSGAPIIHEGDVTHIVGSHWGGICRFTPPPEFHDEINVFENLNLCDHDNDVYYYRMFSAWENVVDVLGIQ